MKEKLIDLVKRASIEEVLCNSDGEPIDTILRRVVKRELVEPFTNYLIDNGVTVQEESVWIINPDGYYPYCKECRYEPEPPRFNKDNRTPCCPNCGRKMRKEIE